MMRTIQGAAIFRAQLELSVKPTMLIFIVSAMADFSRRRRVDGKLTGFGKSIDV
jgi:hypothetical protein